MSGRFFQVSIRFDDGVPKTKELVPAFDKALDWIRFAPNCWIVWSNNSAETLYKRIKPLLSEKDHVFVVALDISERQGWMSKSFWDWLKQERET
jgi:hypothetical protein